ncbi:MAG: DUF3048 domain-containing protein [Desulfoferrobacter sp.]
MAIQQCQLVCPDCRSEIVESTSGARVQLVCENGHGPWPIQNGIPWFTIETSKYDGLWAQTYRVRKPTGFFEASLNRNIHWGIPHLFAPMLAQAGKYPLEVLDVGCGGGWEFLRQYGRVTGVDISPTALEAAARVYDSTVGAYAWRLPFPDSCFDVVTSFWLIEHLTQDKFACSLREFRRVLHPDGHLMSLVDLHSCKPILRWARAYPTEYRHYHVENVGHYGLRSLNYTRHMLRQAGYLEKTTIPINKSSLLQPVTALWMFNNDLGRKSRLLSLYVLLCQLAMKSTVAHRVIYNLLMEYHRWADRRLPDSYAFSAIFDWKVSTPPEKVKPPLPDIQGSIIQGTELKTTHLDDSSSSRSHNTRRPVAIMLDNVPNAFPQRGLAQAAIVFQAQVEGLCTRLMAVYSNELPSQAGPLRSARPYFMDWAGEFQPFFVHCGASPQARLQMENPNNLIGTELRYRIDEGATTPVPIKNAVAARFDLTRKRPHFVFVLPRAIFEQLEDLSLMLPAKLRSEGRHQPADLVHCDSESKQIWRGGIAQRESPSPPREVEVRLQIKAILGERFIWNQASKGFRRVALNGNQVIAGSEVPGLLIRNLIVLETLAAPIPDDPRGRMQIQSCGEGPGYIWRSGPKINLTWRKHQPDKPLELFDERNEKIRLRPGLTWIHFLGPDGKIQVK